MLQLTLPVAGHAITMHVPLDSLILRIIERYDSLTTKLTSILFRFQQSSFNFGKKLHRITRCEQEYFYCNQKPQYNDIISVVQYHRKSGCLLAIRRYGDHKDGINYNYASLFDLLAPSISNFEFRSITYKYVKQRLYGQNNRLIIEQRISVSWSEAFIFCSQ